MAEKFVTLSSDVVEMITDALKNAGMPGYMSQAEYALEAFQRSINKATLIEHKPLTDSKIKEEFTKAVADKRLSWLGFEQDSSGRYTIPSISPYHYQIFRIAEQAHGIV